MPTAASQPSALLFSPRKKKRSRYAAKRCLFLVKWENGASFCAGDQDRIFHTQWRIAALRMKRAILYVKSAPIYGLTTGRCFLSGASLRFYVYGKQQCPTPLCGRRAFCVGKRKCGRRHFLFICKQNMNTHTLNEGISFSKGPKSFAGSPILKIMSNFVDAFAQAKPHTSWRSSFVRTL